MTNAKAHADAYVDTDSVHLVKSAEMVDDVACLSTTFASKVHRPTTVRIVKNASKKSQSVSVRGHSHTKGGQSVPMDGEVSVDMTFLDSITLDPGKMLMTVQTGATWCRDAFGSDELGQRTLDLLSGSLTAQTLKSYAGRLSPFAEFCHDSENISPLEATTATIVRLRKGATSAANAIGVPLSHICYQGGWVTNSDVVLDYIAPNVLPSRGAWFFFGHIAPLRHFQVQ
eukprot:jgi/Tetstr1/462685/TSEL_007651.t1